MTAASLLSPTDAAAAAREDQYAAFLHRKTQLPGGFGFDPVWLPDCLMPFQRHLDEWAIRRGRAALFTDCGTGKSLMSLVFAENVVRRSGGRFLILTPLAVARQFAAEAERFGVDAAVCMDGRLPAARVVITNYEKLHLFDPSDFAGAACDEASILKSFRGETRKRVTRFLSKMRWRLLLSATPSPNDYTELGSSSEALGDLTRSEMLGRFFRYLDDKGQARERRKRDVAEGLAAMDANYYRKLSYRVAQSIGQYRLKHHAVTPFWRWVASWARACRRPSDLGFSDDGFDLPPLTETVHVVRDGGPPADRLFEIPAVGLHEERKERKRTLHARCEAAARLCDHDEPVSVWCHTNAEGDALVKAIPGAEQIAGATPDERRVELYDAFAAGELRVLVLKPKIGAWGLNWQHCNRVVTFATHSMEQHYQAVRRHWRFRQTRPVFVDVVATPGEAGVVENLKAKQARADLMFEALVREMNDAAEAVREDLYILPAEAPKWL
ncbi:helicase-related protein [Alienimonas sp. DA493]|uniref:helicase-related protein n=1 Tax=Alienimonas sp. DA493 TaxID=3373605 RepID=UPI00375459E7